MNNLEQGNLNDLVNNKLNTNGWFLGQFIEKNNYFFHSDDFEIKWGIHKKGEKREGSYTDDSKKTISILISGSCKIVFSGNSIEFLLNKTGDFIAFDTKDDKHTFECIDDCIIMSIRSPSIPYVRKKD